MLHCGSALPGPVFPKLWLPNVCDLPAVDQGLPHDLLIGHMLSGLTSLWGCSCLNASKQATTRRGVWMLCVGKLEKGGFLPSCHKCWDCAGPVNLRSAVRGMPSQLLK